MEECAICGEPLDDDAFDTLTTGQPVCADAKACVRRWVAMSEERRARIRRLHPDPTTDVETR